MDTFASHHATLADLRLLEQNSFTYVSDCHNTVSWIDHIIINDALFEILHDVYIDYGIISSDHRPLLFNITADSCVDCISNVSQPNLVDCQTKITVGNWDACSENVLKSYTAGLTTMLSSACMPSLCCRQNCSELSHRQDIDKYLDVISACIKEATHNYIPSKKVKNSDLCVAGWNDL